MEDVKVKPKAVNDFKLPFELTHGIFGKLTVQIPWKSNFSSPTIIDVENVDIVLNFISPSNWEFIDYYSYDVKLKYLETFFTSKITELKEALNAKNKKPIRSDTYLTRLQMKIIDNLHINFKNIHIRLEDNINKPFSSMGFTLEEILIVNTNENWEETFINRTDVSFTNNKVYKLLKIKQFGFYLDVNTTTTNNNKASTISDEMYLIKPVSVIGKMEQIVNNLTDNLKDETTAKMLITVHLDKLKLDLNKNQYDKIVNILNHISLYQRFQYCKYDSQKYNYYKRLYFNSCGFNVYNKDTYMTWWKYAVKMVMKRNKMYLGNVDEFKINNNVYEYYKEQFNELFYQVVECNCAFTKDKKVSDMLNKDNEMMLRKIIEVVDLNVLYTWEIDVVQKYFKKTNIANSLNPANAQRAFFMSFFGQSSSNNDNNSSSTTASTAVSTQQSLLSKEEEAKIEEIFIQLKEDINTELKLSEKYIKFKVVFTLNEGSITFTSLSSLSSLTSSVMSSESFTFIFKSLYITVSKSDISTYIETTLSEFNINMNTTLSKNNTKTIKITTSPSSSSSNIASPNNDYIWKLQLRLNDPKSSENSSLNFHIKTFNILYHQRFIECIISFFVIKSFTISDDLMNYAYETVTEIKTKTSEQIKHAISNHIIVNITIDKRTINLPINKYNMKQSKYFIADIGSISISNAVNHSIYVMNFNTVNLFYNSDNTLHNAFQIINNLKFELTIEVKKDKTIMLALFINNAITVNLSDEVYYVLMCIKDILQPTTHHNDYYDVIEDNIMDIKKNCKIVSKVNKKSNLDVTEIYYKECFSVISGGYIYFFDKVDDEYFSSYFYIKNAVISIIDSNDKGEINIQGKYDNINLQFGSKQKMEKFLKILRERINEINIFVNDSGNIISDNDNIVDPLKIVMKMEVNVSALNILLFSNKDMRDPYLNLNNNNVVLNHIYTFKINEMCLTLTTHPYDYIFSFSIGDIELLDEAFNKASSSSSHNNNNNNLYQLLTSKETTQNTLNAIPNNNNNNKNIVNVDVMLINPKSPLYKNSSIVVNITIGYLYCIWNPYSIRKLLFFIIHNDIFKQEIKRSCMSITPSLQISNSSTMNTLLSQYTLNEDNNIKPTCNGNNNTLTLLLNASFSKLHVIWIQPVTCEYFIEILLGHSTLHVEMTIDHFTINGILGNVTMYDLSNYLNNTLHNNRTTSSTSTSTSHKTTLLSFQSDSSLTVNFTSYSYNCPLLQNNYTSTCLVIFNSVRLNFIHEHFFRCFHYIFDEFLNSLQIPPLIRKFRNANNKIPLIVSLSSFEFTKIEVMFKNPQIQIKPYDNCNDYFLIDLGIINVHNTYNKVKGKLRQAKEEERYMVTYTFKLENMNITSTFNNNTFVDNTDGVVLLKLTSFMNNEDNFYNDDILDKSFTIDIVLDKDVKVNLTQSEFAYLLKTMDWNVLFRDGNEKIYEYKQHYITYFNVEKQSLFESNSNVDLTLDDNDNEVNVTNYIAFNINVSIKCLTLQLYDNYYKEHFLSFTLSNTYINFINKLNKQIELYINFQNVKAIAISSQLLFEYKQQEVDVGVNNKTQFTIRIVSDPDKDKNLILKVTNLKFIINIAMFNLIKTFFMEIPPHEQPLILNNNSNSGDSDSSGNVESKPSLRINLDIKNILICLPTSNDECFCLSTDLFLLYKTARIDQAKRELVNTFNLLTWKLNNESNVYVKQQLEKELSNNTKEISHLNISFYDISPFTSTISQLTFNHQPNTSVNNVNNSNNTTKRFLTKFNFNFISSTSMQFRHPNNFILSSHSNISIKQLLCKVAYTDVIVLINAINHNFNTHISSFPLTNTNTNNNANSSDSSTSFKVQKMNESLIHSNTTNNSNNSSNITEKLINKGMGIDEIECDIIQITLIDNHSHTFFPFLSLVLKHIKLIKENYNIKQNTINIEFVCKVIIYNYYAGEWEPLLESTKVLIDKTTDNTYTNMNMTSHHFNINIHNDLNINVSDLSIAFLYSTFKLWYDNFTSLLLQNKTQLINQHTNSKVSNHRVINLSGRTMTVYVVTAINSVNISDKKQLCVLRNGEYYDIEYQEDAFIERKKMKKHYNTSNSVNSVTTSSSIRNDKAISIHFDDISIGTNTILIDNITTKKYKINTTLLKQKYNTHNELSQFEYLMSEVKITNLKKTITICSPLIFHNQLSKTLYVNLSKKNYTITSTLKPNETLAIGYEYFDGNISFKIGNDDEQERGCDVRTFLDKEFTNYEMRFDDTRICFFNLKKKMKYVTAIVICSPVVVDNCLPLNIEFVIKGNKICIGKGEKEHIDNISLYNELVCERGEFVVGRYVNKGKVVFYDSSSSIKNGSHGDKKGKDVVTKYIDMCYRSEDEGSSSSNSGSCSSYTSSDINILVTLINSQYKDSNVRIIFHCSGLIYNNTNLPIYAIPSDNNTINNSSNAIVSNNNNKNKNENIHILSYQQNNLTFAFTKPNTNTLYSSNTVSLNTIGIITSLTFLPNDNTNSSSSTSLNHEFILENTFSPITQDPTINILTNIITIHPKYILCNKTTYPFYYFIPFSMENFSDISPQNSNELCPGLLQPYTSQTVFFSNDFKHKIRLRPIEEQSTYQSGSKWNWSGLINVYYDNIITVQFEGKGEKKYFNIEKKVKQYTTYVIIDETTLHNSKYVIINESENVILNAYEPCNKAMSSEVVLPQCNAVFGWNSNMLTKTMRVELLLVHNNESNASDKCKYSVADVKEFEFRDAETNSHDSNSNNSSNSSNDDKIYINGKECSFPVCEIISLTKTNNNNNIHNANNSNNSSISSDIKIKFEISTNGMRKVIKISPYTSTSASPFETNILTHTTTYEFTTKIHQLGINIITDNRYLISSHKHNYTRNELAFISFKHIHTYYKSEHFINSTAYNVDMQCKIKYIQIDNMQHYITQYPIILHMITTDTVNNNSSNSNNSDDNRETHPFFNIAASYSKGDVKQNEPIKFTYFSYLIQAFYINIDNEIFEGVVGFINSITQQLNTSINKVHVILRKNTSNNNTNSNVLYLEPEWLNSNNIISNSPNIFFTHFESSSIEMILSFKASSALEQFLTSNPLFTKVLSSLSNIEHSHLLLNGSFMNNLYISYPNLINLILNQYKQHFLTKLLTIVGSIEILGNPLNLFRSLSIGVKDFVTKPIEGIVRGPLDGVEGAIQGGYSLIKHTINGAFSYTSNIASGISKSILHLSQDDTYIKAIEKEKIETQPKNFVFGLGYGISSLCNGVFSGICDAVIKPIEETQKKGITGLGTGIVKGIGGLFSKPVVGVLQLVSNTSDGIKNTFQTYNDDECGYNTKCKQIRRKRPFYGKFKCIKKYNVVHAKLLEFVVMEIEVFKNKKRKIDFLDVETYRNVKGEDNMVLFLTKSVVFVDVIRRCVKEEIPFAVINKAEVDKRKESVCIYFNKEFKGKIQAEVYLKKGDCEEGDSIAKKVNAYVKQ